ncbi:MULTISPECIES: SSI family serine proteinase inhibitor [Thermomonosporaceae]|uniref:SSI family serine proteinase inhibitor n=1 Tax=Thermomonosporaceae TaxID=2012 RepID=UPI00255B1FAF|nr:MULTISPECIES: SSI family serine proteinase inhibitor [Thermomonosporaceae]MDL4773572.1 SSI family serine proteinase inhibitor [Actinomadura xylanilytica]
MRYRTLLFTTPGLAMIMSLAACGDEQAAGPADRPSATTSVRPSESPAAENKLTVQVRASAEAPAKTWTLGCAPAGGDHPKADQACAVLAKAKAPFAAPPKNQMCTKIYGGPETATVKGTWQGKPVDAKFTRADGCELHRWSGLAPLFGGVPKVR